MKHYHIISGKTGTTSSFKLPNFTNVYLDREDMEVVFEDIYKQILKQTFELFESNETVMPYSRSIKIEGYVLAAFECGEKGCLSGA